MRSGDVAYCLVVLGTSREPHRGRAALCQQAVPNPPFYLMLVPRT